MLSLTDFTLIFVLLCATAIVGAQPACSEEEPFLLPPSNTYCVDTSGIARIAFTLRNFGGVGNYTVSFPDGVDTVYTGVATSVRVEHDLRFECGRPPGNPLAPTKENPFYDYRGELTITRTDCVDDQGDPRRGSYDFNVVPNPLLDIMVSDLSCRSAPFEVDMTALLCQDNLVEKFAWFLDGKKIADSDKRVLEDVVIREPGLHLIRLEVEMAKGCGPFFLERAITISAAPTLDVEVAVDSSELCSPTITVTPATRARNATSYLWTTNSPAVSFSDVTIPEPLITIDNSTPGTRVITLTASNETCAPVSESFTFTTFSGQEIRTTSELQTCTSTPFRFCDRLVFSPPVATINWLSAGEAVEIVSGNTTCPEVTFAEPGVYLLTASGTDVCGLPYSIPVSVSVRDGTPLEFDTREIDTLCSADRPVDLSTYISPADRVREISGPGVSGMLFDPAGMGGPVSLTVVDSCGQSYPLDLFVVSEGSFAGGDLRICRGQSINLAAIQDGAYSGPGVTGNVFRSSEMPAQTYTINYISSAYCGGAGTFTITVEDAPVADFGIANEACSGGGAGAVYSTEEELTLVNASAAGVLSYRILETGDSALDQASASFTLATAGFYTIEQVVSFPGGACTDTLLKTIELRAPFQVQSTYRIDSSACDSVTIFFSTVGLPAGISTRWDFSNGDTASGVAPVQRIARPVRPRVLEARSVSDNGCFQVRDTLHAVLPLRFQVAFGILNDNRTVCSGDTVRLVNNTVGAHRITVTYPDGHTEGVFPEELVLTNSGPDVLAYPISLTGSKPGCPDRTVTDTVFVLPVATRSAFGLNYADNCSPAEVQLVNLSSPGSSGLVYWGDESSPQRVGEADTVSHRYAVSRDTVYTISLVARLCGIDTFTNSFRVRATPDPVFSVEVLDAYCTGDAFRFVPRTVAPEESLEWTFGDGRTSVLPRPEVSYETAGTYRAVLLKTNQNGCTASDTFTLTVTEYGGSAGGDDFPAETCVGSPFRVATSTTSAGYRYDYGNGLITTAPVDRPYDRAGDYRFTLTTFDGQGCRRDTSAFVRVHPEFSVRILPDAGDTTIELGDFLDLAFDTNPLRGIDSIQWWGDAISSRSGRSLRAAPVTNSLYRLEVSDVYGCSAADSILVVVRSDYAGRVYTPNAFSPNGDGVNETFALSVKPNSVRSLRSLRVFSRWGELMFECGDCLVNDGLGGWNGRLGSGEPAKPGTYVWIAEVDFADGVTEVLRGEVVLVR